MAKKKVVQAKPLERIVTGQKPFSCHNKKGERIVAQPGDTVWVHPRSAKAFASRLVDPKVHAARLIAEQAEADAEVEAAEAEEEEDTGKSSTETDDDEGGDSGES